MRTLLRINNEPILNFYDLEENFFPAEMLRKLADFSKFAQVHCQDLTTCLTDAQTNKRRPAKYINKKNFWLELLKRDSFPQGKTPAQLLDELLSEFAEELRWTEDVDEEAFRKEASDGALFEKLEAVVQGGVKDARDAVLMLAISELCEVDARNVSPDRWTDGEQEDNAAQEPKSFTYRDVVYLEPRKAHYRYLLYEEKALPEGERIRTVKIMANRVKSGASQPFVTVELLRGSDGQKQTEVTIAPGEHRFVNVACDRVIKFLPSLSVSLDQCAILPNDAARQIRVKPKDGEEWALNLKNADDVSFISAGDRDRGLMLIQDGRINATFFEDTKYFNISRKLQMIARRTVAEARITESGFEILLDDGTVLSDSERVGHGVITLSEADPIPEGPRNARECAVSPNGQSAALLLSGGKYKTFFEGGFRVLEDGRTVKFDQT